MIEMRQEANKILANTLPYALKFSQDESLRIADFQYFRRFYFRGPPFNSPFI